MPKSKRSKSPVYIHLRKDVLHKYGYHDISSKTDRQRHHALNKALKEMKPLELYRRLIALATLNKNTKPQLAAMLRQDAAFVKNTAAYKKRSKSRKSRKSRKSKN